MKFEEERGRRGEWIIFGHVETLFGSEEYAKSMKKFLISQTLP